MKGRNREKNMTKYEILKETELFVLDMDGTFYLDNDVIDGALDFLDEVKKAGKRFVFIIQEKKSILSGRRISKIISAKMGSG